MSLISFVAESKAIVKASKALLVEVDGLLSQIGKLVKNVTVVTALMAVSGTQVLQVVHDVQAQKLTKLS